MAYTFDFIDGPKLVAWNTMKDAPGATGDQVAKPLVAGTGVPGGDVDREWQWGDRQLVSNEKKDKLLRKAKLLFPAPIPPSDLHFELVGEELDRRMKAIHCELREMLDRAVNLFENAPTWSNYVRLDSIINMLINGPTTKMRSKMG